MKYVLEKAIEKVIEAIKIMNKKEHEMRFCPSCQNNYSVDNLCFEDDPEKKMCNGCFRTKEHNKKKCESCEHTIGDHHYENDPFHPSACSKCSCGWLLIRENGWKSEYKKILILPLDDL